MDDHDVRYANPLCSAQVGPVDQHWSSHLVSSKGTTSEDTDWPWEPEQPRVSLQIPLRLYLTPPPELSTEGESCEMPRVVIVEI